MTKHGHHGTKEYIAWRNMKARCRNPRYPDWKHYGGRGILVHPSFDTFVGFFSCLGNCPPGMSLDRINNYGNYEPGNVRWASRTIQMRNRSNNNHITHEGRTQTLSDWADEIGIPMPTLWARLQKWPIGKSLTTPLMSLEQASQLGHAVRWGS